MQFLDLQKSTSEKKDNKKQLASESSYMHTSDTYLFQIKLS